MIKNKIQNFIVTGCSFTASLLDNILPTSDAYNSRASHWPHTVFSKLGPEDKKFINLAMGAGGNMAAFTNLSYFLNLYKEYTPENTLIGFNITGLNRKDKICLPNDINESEHRVCIDVPTYLNISWYPDQYTRTDDLNLTLIQNATRIIDAISYLELRGYTYFFMIMNDDIYTKSPSWFQGFLDERRNKNWILFGEYLSMLSFSKSINGCVSSTDLHPTMSTHKLIGQHVINFLNI